MRQDFTSIFGFPPYAWQDRLYCDHFAPATLPEAIDIPTGMGKTAVMALWLLARLRGAKLPRRLVYIVDRRVVVDQATEVANQIAQWASSHGHDLAVSTLRGQHRDNRKWLEDPSSLAIIVGTVDMIGSRLLFEGYGVGRGMRPFHAGLLGADTLVLLDEAHLCPPFHAMLRSLQHDPGLHPATPEAQTLIPPPRILPLSATLSSIANPFQLTAADVDPVSQPQAHARFCASKQLTLTEIPVNSDVAEWLAKTALALPHGRNLVFCDSRQTAIKVAGLIEKETAKIKIPVEMLTGARRVYEREQLAARLTELGYLGDKKPQPHAIVVSTSAGEVGVDLDADNMACDLVAFERMAQRLGRVNRAGGEGRAAVVRVGWQKPKEKSGGEEARTRTAQLNLFLKQQRDAIEALPRLGDGSYQASPRAFSNLRQTQPEIVSAASTPDPKFPKLERAHAEAWSMTSLREHPGRPDPQPWLRGWDDQGEAEVEIIWRRWLPWRAGQTPIATEVEDFFAAAPPLAQEKLRIEASLAAKWLKARAEAVQDKTDGEVEIGCLLLSPALELRNPGSFTVAQLLAADDLRNALVGSTVVVSSTIAGLDKHGLLANTFAAPPACWDDDDGWSKEDFTQAGLRLCQNETELGEEWRVIGRFTWSEATSVMIAALRNAGGALRGDMAVSRREQTLSDHETWVVEETRRLAHALTLPLGYAQMLEIAAAIHDAGKARKLWQDAMGAPVAGRPFAKTRGKGAPARLKIGGLTYRHEFGSLAEAENLGKSNSDWQALPAELIELALHLVASHHGFARPLIAPVDPDEPHSSGRQHDRAERAMLRFARLQQQWGPWGLAWWEAVFRAADQRASRRLDAAAHAKTAVTP